LAAGGLAWLMLCCGETCPKRASDTTMKRDGRNSATALGDVMLPPHRPFKDKPVRRPRVWKGQAMVRLAVLDLAVRESDGDVQAIRGERLPLKRPLVVLENQD